MCLKDIMGCEEEPLLSRFTLELRGPNWDFFFFFFYHQIVATVWCGVVWCGVVCCALFAFLPVSCGYSVLGCTLYNV